MFDSNPKGSAARLNWRRVLIGVLSALAVLGTGGAVVGLVWIRTSVVKETVVAQNVVAQNVAPPVPTTDAQKRSAMRESWTNPGRPIAEDEPAFWSDIAIYKAAGPKRPRPIVVMKRGKQPTDPDIKGLYQGLLARELVRQSFLLCAREEFGALTRDVPLGDPEVEGKPDLEMRLGSRFRVSHDGASPADPAVGRITLVTGTGDARKVLMSREFQCNMLICPQINFLVAAVEMYSRNIFRKTLVGQGLKRISTQPKKLEDEEGLPEEIEARLGQLAETEQFAAIRALHGAMREKGETSARLGGLARAYATLGSLCESHLTADYLSYQARSLLYGQRAVFHDQDAPPSLRAQAYAEALAGCFDEARDDLDLADKTDGGIGPPSWAVAVRAYCKSDGGAADAAVKERPHDPLALYLRFLTKRHASGYWTAGEDQICREEIVAAGRALLKQVPDCFRVHDGIADVGGVANLHPATSVPLELFDKAVRARLAVVPALPKKVAQAAKEGSDEVDLRQRLVAAAVDDPAEFSWGVLARQFREIRFLQVNRRLDFLRRLLGVPVNEFAADALPFVADHPARTYLECYTEPIDRAGFLAKFKSLDFADVLPTSDHLRSCLDGLDDGLERDLRILGTRHQGLGTVPCQEAALCRAHETDKPITAHNTLRFNEESTLGRGAMIAANWDVARPHVEQWEKDHGGDTFVLAQLGFHWLKAGKFEKAEGYFQRALAQSHDGWIFTGLAETYRRQGEIDRWMKALDDYLKSEELSLDHPQALQSLARYLMERKEYRKARPYAEMAAQSWAGWAMQLASRCAEEVKDWEAAELWIARTSERYANNWLDWYAWCQRTGRGDVKAAAALVENQLAARAPAATGIEALAIGVFLLLQDDDKAARNHFARLYRADNSTVNGALLALACDAVGDKAARDAALKAVSDDPAPRSPKTAEILRVLAPWLAGDGKSPLDRKRIDEILDGMPPDARPNSSVLVGLFLDRHAKPEDAVDYLRRANTKDCYLWYRFLVLKALREHGVKTVPLEVAFHAQAR